MTSHFIFLKTFFNKSFSFNMFCCFIILLASCHSDKTRSNDNTDTSKIGVIPNDSMRLAATKKIFRAIPSPIEVASILQKENLEYRSDILNPYTNASKYTTNFSKALNLGVYGADLAYSEMNNQAQVASLYMKASNTLADGLGVSSVFESSGYPKRFQANIGNRDSLLFIIADLNRELNDYFTDNKRGTASSLVIVGSWVEGIYIATSLVENKKNKNIIQRIAEQKLVLNNIVLMLSEYQSDKEIQELINKLNGLQQTYNRVTIEYANREITTDSITKKTVIKGQDKISISGEVLKNISDKIKEIRYAIVKTN